jgi:hypothetical protein
LLPGSRFNWCPIFIKTFRHLSEFPDPEMLIGRGRA